MWAIGCLGSCGVGGMGSVPYAKPHLTAARKASRLVLFNLESVHLRVVHREGVDFTRITPGINPKQLTSAQDRGNAGGSIWKFILKMGYIAG